MTNKLTYWINTEGKRVLLFRLISPRLPNETLSMAFKIKQTNWFVFNVFKYTKVNLIAKDRFAWLRS